MGLREEMNEDFAVAGEHLTAFYYSILYKCRHCGWEVVTPDLWGHLRRYHMEEGDEESEERDFLTDEDDGEDTEEEDGEEEYVAEESAEPMTGKDLPRHSMNTENPSLAGYIITLERTLAQLIAELGLSPEKVQAITHPQKTASNRLAEGTDTDVFGLGYEEGLRRIRWMLRTFHGINVTD